MPTTLVAERSTVRQSEKPIVVPRPAEQIQEPDPQGREILDRIIQDGDPERVLQDIAGDNQTAILAGQVNLLAFYQTELARSNAKQVAQAEIWKTFENRAAETEPWYQQEAYEGYTPRPVSVAEKIRRQALSLQARIEGVRDIGQFQQLVDYFESTVTERESAYVKLPKGLSEERKQQEREKWAAKGYTSNHYFYEYDKYTSFFPERQVPLRLKREQVKALKGLMSTVNNPVEIAEGLRKIGFHFSEYTFSSEEQVAKLAQLFSAPHAKEAIAAAQRVKHWNNEWFASAGEYWQRRVEVGQIDFLIQLAQNPDPQSVLPEELVQKINVISSVMKWRVGVPEIERFKTIADNPDYLELASIISQYKHSYYTEGIPIFDNMVALDQAGVLKPLIALRRAGVAFGDSSLNALFATSEARDKPQEIQQQVVLDLQEQLSDPGIQAFMQDPIKQEFVGLLANITGQPVSVDELRSLDDLFGEGLSKRNEAIYLVKLLYGSEEIKYKRDLSLISGIINNSNTLKAFTDQGFPRFLENLRSRVGFEPSEYNHYFQVFIELAEAFSNPGIRQGLMQDSTVEVIKAIGAGMDLSRPEYYIRLGNNPNMVSAINALRGIGCRVSDDYRFSADMLEAIANNPEVLSKLESPELKSLSARLVQEFGWKAKSYEIMNLIGLYDDKELQLRLFTPENLEFIKRIRSHGLSLSDVEPMLDLDPIRRNLLIQMVNQFNYYPDFTSWERQKQQEMLSKLIEDGELRTKLFSEQTQEIFKRLQKDFGYHRLEAKDIETIVNTPSDFPDFIGELKEKYKYSFQSKDLIPLLQLAANKEGFNGLLDSLVSHGYQFKTEDIASISQLMPHAERLPIILATVNQILSSEEYVFNVQHISFLLQLEPVIDRLPAAVAVLSEVMGYKFNVRDSQQLAFVIEGGYTKDRLIGLKRIHDKYKDQNSGEFGIGAIQNAAFIEGNEDTIARLESYNYKFNLRHIQNLRSLLESSDKGTIFQALDILRDNLPFSYNPNLSQYYVRLVQIPGIEDKLREAGTKVAKEDLLQENNFKLFVALSGNADLYVHARKLLSDDYFRNIRDAQNRFSQFNSRMLSGEIPDEVLAKIFAVSGKATELDRIALKYGINAEIAKAAQNENWQDSLLHATNFQEANEAMTRIMTDLAIPVIYSGLEREQLSVKQKELIELAGRDKEFDDTLEISCRSVGVYGQRYPNKGQEFDVLMGAIRQSLELNLERNPKAYSEKRAELSAHQFDRIFEGMSQDVRDRVMKTWLDLSPRRRLRVSGEVITAEESTLNRLNRIRDIVRTDLSVHLQELFTTKVRELETAVERGDISGPGVEQLAIYKQYLMTPEGVIRQDIPMMYRSVEAFIRNAQAALKNSETPKEEKGKLGKILGTYQGISDSLKAIYRLGTISEERYKARRDYLNEVEKHIGEFSGALKRLKLLDPDRRSVDVNTRALEEEVLLDFGKLKGTMAEENVSGQTVFETESTVAFINLARAPEITQSCQRLTEVTGYNQAAYSRLLDGSNEMIDIYEMRNGEKNRLARSFVELSRVRLTGEEQPKLAVLIDREYVNPQYQNFGNQFSSEMMLHMLDRLSAAPELSLVFDSGRFTANPDVQKVIQARGYQLRQVSGEYFVNESNVKLAKYYDSLGGISDVSQSSWRSFSSFYIIEKIK